MTENTRQICGADHDDPNPYALQPGHDYVELSADRSTGSSRTSPSSPPTSGRCAADPPRSAFGPDGRADYEPRPGDTDGWGWSGDAPW
ncbi:hypothetical protein [Streptomyces sp. NPDC088180]|uniref:hypothetical protein n=1 Tax=Streptomyces sp. NPDC088180 TaxID=3365837 RepID=UPI003816FAAA